MRNFIQKGDVVPFTAGGALVSGQVIKISDVIGIVTADFASGEEAQAVLSGVFEVAKKSTDNVAQGDALYWDAGNAYFTKTSAGNTYAGVAFRAAGVSATKVHLHLNFAPRAAAAGENPTPVYVAARIGNLDTTVPGYAVAPIAGTITKIWSVVEADATGAAAVAAQTVVTCSIGATPITNGALTIAGSAPIGDVDSATPSAANVVTAGQMLKAASDGADTAAHPATVFFEITPA